MIDSRADNTTAVASTDWTLIILAGGRGSRMGGQDKGLLRYHGEAAVCYLAARLASPRVLISANRNQQQYRALGFQVVADQRDNFAGPLAGLEAALVEVSTARAVVVPCDMPSLPAVLPARLLAALQPPVTLAVANDGERLQPLCLGLEVAACLPGLRRYLDEGGVSAHGWLSAQQPVTCHFDCPAAFANINSAADYAGYVG